MKQFGITGWGAYVPRLRMDRAAIADAHRWMAPSLKGLAKGARAFCGWDEDPITMAVEATRDCLGSRNASGLASFSLASTTLPYADLQNSVIAASALRLPQGIRSFDVANSQRAGTSGLVQALAAGETAVFVAADNPTGKPASTQEMIYGAGAAAFSLGHDGVVARCIGAGSVAAPFVDHFRAAGERYDYFWEERWIRDEGYLKLVPQAVKRALGASNVGIDGIQHLVLAAPFRGIGDAVGKKLGFAGKLAAGLEDGCGYAGTAHGLLMLISVMEQAKPGERILVVGFGQGADAMVLETTDAITSFKPRRGLAGALADSLVTNAYLRMLSFNGGIDLEWGMRAEKDAKTQLSEQYRSSFQIAGFVAARCGRCGTTQFPQKEYCVNPQCHAPASEFEQTPLADVPCKVMTYTADWLTYHPAPPLYVGFVQFENGARLLMEMVDVGPGGIEIGTPLRSVFRVKEADKNLSYARYFWKATPIGGAQRS